MTLLQRIRQTIGRLGVHRQAPPWPDTQPPADTPPDAAEEQAARLGEQLRLAREIADDAARSEIECTCEMERVGQRYWYDTQRLSSDCPEFVERVDRALRYLELRSRVKRHPVQTHLVRFSQ